MGDDILDFVHISLTLHRKKNCQGGKEGCEVEIWMVFGTRPNRYCFTSKFSSILLHTYLTRTMIWHNKVINVYGNG